MGVIDTVVFDLGGVLLDWDPRYVLTGDGTTTADELVMALDIDGVQRALDLGRPPADVRARWRSEYREHVAHIDRYFDNWHDTVAGPLDDVVAIAREVRDRGLALYALSNFSGEYFRDVSPKFAFLEWFDGLLIPGDEGIIKPDPACYHLLLERFGLSPERIVFIDDRLENVEAARAAGLAGIHFLAAPQLREDLTELGVLAS